MIPEVRFLLAAGTSIERRDLHREISAFKPPNRFRLGREALRPSELRLGSLTSALTILDQRQGVEWVSRYARTSWARLSMLRNGTARRVALNEVAKLTGTLSNRLSA